MVSKFNLFITFLLLQLGNHHCNCSELFSSMVGWEHLVDKEDDIISFILILQHIEKKINQINDLIKIHQYYELRHDEAESMGHQFVGNPVNAFLLLKRLTIDWERALQLIEDTTKESDLVAFLRMEATDLPDDEDITGAALAIMQLQDVYGLSPTDICNGKVSKTVITQPLTGDDCFLIARVGCVQKKFDHCISWIKQGLAVVDEWTFLNRVEALKLQSLCLYEKAFETMNEAQLLLYNDTDSGEISEAEQASLMGNDRLFEEDLLRFAYVAAGETEDRDMEYKNFCSNSFAKNSGNYKCYYKTDHPFLHLARIKVEVVLEEPRVLVFRDVLSNNEIESIKQISIPQLQRAGVLYGGDTQATVSTDKLGKEAWLNSSDSHIIRGIQRRIQQMTDYDVVNAKDDIFEAASAQAPGGERQASVLFYMSEPEFGGNTVFPKLAISVVPSLNDALFWNNLLPDGQPDYRTLHTSCPVLSGIKWIVGSFISEKAQTQCRLA